MVNGKNIMTGFLPILLLSMCACHDVISTNNTAPSTGATATKAVDFLQSIGVNSSVSRRGETLEQTVEATKYLGIQWIRTGYEGNIPVDDLIQLHQQTGARMSYGLLSGGTDIARLLDGAKLLANEGALLAIEGSNEPNNWGVEYFGEKGGRDLSWLPVARLQRDLYQAVKNDPQLKEYPVWSLSENGAQTDNVGLQFLEIPKGAGTLMPDGTKYADFANCHNYIMHPSHPGLYDNQTWNAADPGSDSKVDGLFGNYGLTWANKYNGYSETELETLPRVTTETGASLNEYLTEEKQARLFLNLFLAQFKRGWKHTALYLLRDRTDESGNQQYGFYKPDYTPRKAAVYMHHLTSILADQESADQPGKLDYTIANKPETVHDLLLQKHDRTFELVIWGEKVSGEDEVKVTLGDLHKQITVYDPTQGASAIMYLENVDALTLTLSDHPLIVEIPSP